MVLSHHRSKQETHCLASKEMMKGAEKSKTVINGQQPVQHREWDPWKEIPVDLEGLGQSLFRPQEVVKGAHENLPMDRFGSKTKNSLFRTFLILKHFLPFKKFVIKMC